MKDAFTQAREQKRPDRLGRWRPTKAHQRTIEEGDGAGQEERHKEHADLHSHFHRSSGMTLLWPPPLKQRNSQKEVMKGAKKTKKKKKNA